MKKTFAKTMLAVSMAVAPLTLAGQSADAESATAAVTAEGAEAAAASAAAASVAAPATETAVPAEVAVVRPVTSAYMLEIGGASLTDTYLSPETYRGWSLGLAYQRMQAMRFDPERWVMRLDASVEIDRGRNRADNASTWRIDGGASWGMLRRWSLPAHLTLAVGGSTGIDVGCLYNPRNSNNPASAKAAWTVNLAGCATWATRIGRLPILLAYQPELPLLGCFFSPQYDELYYEIYLGNHQGLAHFATPFSRLAFRHLLTADLRLGGTTLRLGYRGLVYSSEANHLVCNIFTHSFVLGIVTEWISLNPRRPLSQEARVISALY